MCHVPVPCAMCHVPLIHRRLYHVLYHGAGIRYINVEIEQLRAYTQKSIDKGDAVWFGCDVGKDFHRKMAVMDTELYDYASKSHVSHVVTWCQQSSHTS